MIFELTQSELQQEQPQFYQSLASHLSAEEQNTIANVCLQAETMAHQAAALAAQQGVAPNGGAS
jgi:hypothetical protein